MDYSTLPSQHNFGQDIDDAIRVRESSKYNLSVAKMKLLELGAKTFSGGELVASLPNLDVEEYLRCNYQEFQWEAVMRDGSVLKQFQGDKQHHFGHIDQKELVELRWVSNFTTDTSNQEKRVVVALNWTTGKFTFTNGLALGEVRNVSDAGFPEGERKLILKMVKRESTGVSFQDGDASEVTRYNRYILGWEAGDQKVILCVEPNGYTHLWHQ